MADAFSAIHCRGDPPGHPDTLPGTPQERGGQDQLLQDMFEKRRLLFSSGGTSGTRVNAPVIRYPPGSPGTGIQSRLRETYAGLRVHRSLPGMYGERFRQAEFGPPC